MIEDKFNPDNSLQIQRPADAFTLIELLVVIAIIAILAAILLPVLQQAEERGRAAQCINNMHEMGMAYCMYPNENNGNLVPNVSGLDEAPVQFYLQGWVQGGMTWPNSASGQLGYYNQGGDDTNIFYLQNSKLGPYCANQTLIYKCPSDIWTARFNGSGNSSLVINNGQPITRVRSVSMDITVEGNIWNSLKTKIPNYESWWYNQQNSYAPVYAFNKEADYIHLNPSDLCVFLDEQADSINDGNNAAWTGATLITATTKWGDLPAAYHNHGGSFSFADGHAEIHRWLTGNIALPVIEGAYSAPTLGRSVADMEWYMAHSLAFVNP